MNDQTYAVSNMKLIGPLIDCRINKIVSIIGHMMCCATIRIPHLVILRCVYWLKVSSVRLWKLQVGSECLGKNLIIVIGEDCFVDRKNDLLNRSRHSNTRCLNCPQSWHLGM